MAALSKKHAKENKVIDLSALPPCRNVLRIHSERAKFITKFCISSMKNNIGKESFANHGWDKHGDQAIRWIDQAFDDISGIFFNN